MEDVVLAADERRSLASEYALVLATLLTVLMVAGGAAVTAHHFFGSGCSTLARAAGQASSACR
jgi:Flp pilus assembly pilin Flp